MPDILATTIFRMEDQRLFAAISGDTNPIHIDAITARRLLAGEPIVHGMHLLLWAIDRHCAAGGRPPSSINASFRNPALLDQEVRLTRVIEDDMHTDLVVEREGNPLATIRLSAGLTAPLLDEPLPGRPQSREPAIRSRNELENAAGQHPVRAEMDDLARYFPAAMAAMGPLPIAAIMSYSAIVGVECPGLNSLFASVDLNLAPDASGAAIAWHIMRPAPAPAPIRLAVRGGGLRGSLTAFVRPGPVMQPNMDSLRQEVVPGEFSDQRALVVGGSRGLGELTAKILAAGGASVTITYIKGAADARRVQADIHAAGGSCEILELDVTGPMPDVSELGHRHFTCLYYYATPRIGRPHSGSFDDALYEEFASVFVSAFARLVAALHVDVLNIFYPSTVFIDELPKEFPEYVSAKAAGEQLCRYLAKNRPGIHCLVQRLPRLSTDQNATLLRKSCAKPLPIVLHAVRAMKDIAS